MHTPAGRIDTEPGPGLEDSIRAEQLALLTANRADQYVNIVTASLVVAMVRNLYPAWVLALWLGLCVAVVLVRSLVVARYHSLPSSPVTCRRYLRLIIASTVALGVLWGLASSAILLSYSPGIQFFLMIMLGGMMAGGVLGNTASLAAMYGFAMPIIIPSVFAFATRGTDMHLLGVLQALYAGIVLNAGRKFNRVITDNIRLRLAQSGILGQLSASESAMAEAQKLARAGSWDIDLAANTIVMSAEAHRIFAIAPSDRPISFQMMLSRIHPEDRDAVNAHIAGSRRLSATSSIEYRVVMPSGAIKHVLATPRTIFDSAGQPIRIIGSVQDISLRRATEEKQRFANLLLQTQMESSPDGIVVLDASRRIVAFNHRFAAMWRIPLAELENGDDALILARLTAQVKNAEAYAARSEYLFGHPETIGDDEIETLDGRIIERHSVALQPPGGGANLGRVRFFRDISLRRAAQKAQEYANLLLRTQMEASPDGILVVDADRRMTSFNQRFAEIWRIPPAEMRLGNDDVIRTLMRAQIRDSEGYVTDLETLYAHPELPQSNEIETSDGRTIERYGSALISASGAPLGYIRFYNDITERRAAEQKLQFANLLLTTQMEASPDGILVVDANRHVISFNRRLAEIWRLPEADLRAGEDAALRILMAAQTANPAAYSARIAYLAGRPDEIATDELDMADGRMLERFTRTLSAADGTLLGRIWFYTDITAVRQAADALAYRDRLLQAVTAATGVAVRADSLAEGVPEALGKIGEIMAIDRIVVMQDKRDGTPLGLRFFWEAPGVPVPLALGAASYLDAAMAAWRDPLARGVPVFADTATATGAPRAMLDHYQARSICLVPVYVAGLVWGFISVDDCKTARQWTDSEVETLRILADTAGALIVRERARVALEASEDLSRRLTTNAKDAVILSGPDGEILQWNPAAERIFGYTAAEAIGQQPIPLIVRPQDHARVRRAIAAIGPELAITVEFTLMRKDGSDIATEMSVSALPIDGRLGVLSILRDITDRKAAEKKLLVSNIMLKTQMEASPDGILAVDANRRIISCNQRVAEIWNLPALLLSGGDGGAVRAAHYAAAKDPAAFDAIVERHLAAPEERYIDEIETLDNRWIEIQSRSLGTGGGASLGRIWFYRDTTARRAAEALALRRARFDELTGLANRAVFVEAVQSAIAHANRGGAGFAVLFLDLDHFKDVNDTLGHPAGDALLREVAARLLANIRETDTAGRFGGDEFAIAATEIHDPADAALLAEKLLAAIAVPYLIAGNTIHIEASIGVDIFSAAAGPEALLSHADVALYRAKAEGRGMYRFFTPSMDREVHTRVRLGAELREAIAAGQLFLLYQPQVAAASGRIMGVEALVRWNHPTRGVLAPGNFIPIAEATGQIGALGHFVLWEACRQAQEWIATGLPATRVSINISALQFKTALSLEADIRAALRATGLPPYLLELELTETVLMDASREHSDTLRRLRQLGVKISIDDFGTGYSSLDYLRRYPVDHIKIAQSFVKNVETEPGDASIVRAIIGLARTLRIKLIVEGVATRSQLELLQSWGATEVQGFYYARPLPPETILLHLQAGIITPA